MDEEGYYWIAVCEKHFDEHYDEENDGWGEVLEEGLECDHEGCEKIATREIDKNLIRSIEESKPCIEVETGGRNIVMTDKFVESLRRIEDHTRPEEADG